MIFECINMTAAFFLSDLVQFFLTNRNQITHTRKEAAPLWDEFPTEMTDRLTDEGVTISYKDAFN